MVEIVAGGYRVSGCIIRETGAGRVDILYFDKPRREEDIGEEELVIRKAVARLDGAGACLGRGLRGLT